MEEQWGKFIIINSSLTLDYVCRAVFFYQVLPQKSNVPISVISEGMGYDSESITQINLASLDTIVMDKANKKTQDLL